MNSMYNLSNWNSEIAAELDGSISRPISVREVAIRVPNRLPIANNEEEKMVWKQRNQVPRVVIGHRDRAFAAWLGQQLSGVGWDHVAVDNAEEARVLARAERTVALFLDVDLQDESGWLTCDKVTRERPELCVVLMSKDTRPEKHRFATFVGARALVRPRQDDSYFPRAFRGCREVAPV
jgi:CheY-like chemotaxis protein